jgi:hypothetical protein
MIIFGSSADASHTTPVIRLPPWSGYLGIQLIFEMDKLHCRDIK